MRNTDQQPDQLVLAPRRVHHGPVGADEPAYGERRRALGLLLVVLPRPGDPARAVPRLLLRRRARCRTATRSAGDAVRRHVDRFPALTTSGRTRPFAPRVGLAWDLLGNRQDGGEVQLGPVLLQNTGTASSGINPAQSLTSTFDWNDAERAAMPDRQFHDERARAASSAARAARPTRSIRTSSTPTPTAPASGSSTSCSGTSGCGSATPTSPTATTRRTCSSARLYELYTSQVQVADPGPDGIAGNGDDGPTFIVYDIPSPVPASRTRRAPSTASSSSTARSTSRSPAGCATTGRS